MKFRGLLTPRSHVVLINNSRTPILPKLKPGCETWKWKVHAGRLLQLQNRQRSGQTQVEMKFRETSPSLLFSRSRAIRPSDTGHWHCRPTFVRAPETGSAPICPSISSDALPGPTTLPNAEGDCSWHLNCRDCLAKCRNHTNQDPEPYSLAC